MVMNVPMPGHAANIDDRKNVDALSQLIKDHDVIFLLTDSRESRWLPTMLSTLHNKVILYSLLIFRHISIMIFFYQFDISSLACHNCCVGI